MDFAYNSSDADEDFLNILIENVTCRIFDFSTINGAFFIAVFIISLISNVLLLCILFIFEKHNLLTHIFIINLAFSDLIFTVTVPFWAVYHFHHWIFGNVLCKVIIWMHLMGLYSSIFVLTAMTVERFCTVVLNNWPNNNQKKKQYTIGACVGAWLSSIGPSSYDASKMMSDDYYCEVEFTDEFIYYFQIVFLMLIPTAIIIFCNCAIIYTILRAGRRTRHKALSMVLCIVVAYIICWGPYNIVLFIPSKNCEELQRMNIVYNICRLFAHCHCWINPILCMLTQKIRKHLLYILRYKVVKTKRKRSRSHTSLQYVSESRSTGL